MAKETKQDRFKRVAEKRVQNIINGIRSLSSLSNKKVYEYEAAQLKKIWSAINEEIEICKKVFSDPDSRTFKL